MLSLEGVAQIRGDYVKTDRDDHRLVIVLNSLFVFFIGLGLSQTYECKSSWAQEYPDMIQH